MHFLKNTTRGFSLIELMIVITIIGILSAFALPSYQQYTQRARFAEVVTTAAAYKIAVAIAIQQGALLADLTNGTYGIPEKPKITKNLADLTVDNGVITATSTSLVGDLTYILTPNTDASAWEVGGTCLPKGYCNA